MKKFIILLCCLITCIQSLAQNDSAAMQEILAFQQQLNDEFKDRTKSPLDPKDFKKFKGLPFFPVSLAHRVVARLEVTPGADFFKMKTTTSRLPDYRVYGYVVFSLLGKNFRMPVYQSQDLMKEPEYTNYLFFPFTDLTNGKQTYPGGRYIELRIPEEGQDIIIDFNKAYNPYCAYSHRFSCPIVPAENYMDVEVLAGVMYKQKKK